ncbi:WD repeat-containing protein 48 [Termitomyces sp. J132]|nr:WD repeat-containing protein 48 [Termitomyces sp. J132]
MVQQKRRVSYVIPSPAEPVPRLRLPPHGTSRLGSTGPLLIPLRKSTETELPKSNKHPRHRLGISSLALDTSTQLTGRAAPEGILYSAGRDGLVISWDLGIPMKKRKATKDDNSKRRDWEAMTGWADDEEIDDSVQNDGDVLGDVTINPRRRQRVNSQVIPYEKQWETDLAAYNKPGKSSSFRQSAQMNSDWINDILLCNNQQTVISASSDGTVKSWSPHLADLPNPMTIGTHADYVRCLTHSREQNWVASGSFDRTIKLWDLTREGQVDPLVTFNPPDTNAPKSSIYSIAADPFGTMIASGSPERVVRLWDPRTGKRTGKLVGHTDNIRAILISEDAKYLLTGSADASIKLWSLSTQTCLHTFTHHTESVWSLHSSHSTLEIFYSGDRSGLVCKVDVEDCSDVSEGECILLCQDTDPFAPSSGGINKIIAMDDNLLWTASGHSNIKRWSVPQRRSVRASINVLLDLDGRYVRTASIRSVPRQTPVRSPTLSPFKPPLQSGIAEDVVYPMSHARADYEERELASDAVPLQAEPEDVLTGEHGLVRSMILNDRVHALTVDTSGEAAVWDIVRGLCRGRFSREDVASISHTGTVVSQWATADTKTGVLTIHMTEKCFEAEVYADEVGYANDRRFNDESKINIGKWVLRNLFLGFIREEQRMHRSQEEGGSPPDGTLDPSLGRATNTPSRRPEDSTVVQSPHMIPALPPAEAPPIRSSPLLASLIPLHTQEMSLPMVLIPVAADESEPFAAAPPPTSSASVNDYSTIRGRQSLAPGQGLVSASPDDFALGGKTDNTSSVQGGIMGRLKNLGKPRRSPNEASSSPNIGLLVPSADLTTAPEARMIEMDTATRPIQTILSGPMSPPPSSEAPTYSILPNTLIKISEEAVPSYMTVYRGTVASIKHDVRALEEAIPLWLLEYLVLNKIPAIPPHQKISFVLLPSPMPDGEDQLPELLNTYNLGSFCLDICGFASSSFTWITVRKVQEKLAKLLSRPEVESPEGNEKDAGTKPLDEDEFEILCNDVVLHLNMSLAVVRQYIWKQSSELTMYYRRRPLSIIKGT